MKNHPGKIMEKRGNVDTTKAQTRNKLEKVTFYVVGLSLTIAIGFH